MLIETEAETPRTLQDFLVIFDRYFQDKKLLETAHIQFKKGVLKALIGEERPYEPLTAVEIVEMVQKIKWSKEKGSEFTQVIYF